jgi:hypothetical protein
VYSLRIRFKEWGKEMKMEVMTVTPAMALRCLEKNKVANRNLSQSRINAMVSDMVNGHWILTHQGIAFDNDGNLLDGQHRLAACIQSEMPFKTLVTKGLSVEACVAVDNVRPRSITDHARQIGLDISTSHSSIAMCIEYGAEFHDHISIAKKLELIAKYRDGIGFAVAHSRSNSGFQAPCKAVVARAYYSQDHGKLERFMEVYNSMVTEGAKESAATTLRKYLTSGKLYGWSARGEMYRKTETALYYFIRGKPMSKIYGTEKELFPLPKSESLF